MPHKIPESDRLSDFNAEYGNGPGVTNDADGYGQVDDGFFGSA